MGDGLAAPDGSSRFGIAPGFVATFDKDFRRLEGVTVVPEV